MCLKAEGLALEEQQVNQILEAIMKDNIDDPLQNIDIIENLRGILEA